MNTKAEEKMFYFYDRNRGHYIVVGYKPNTYGTVSVFHEFPKCYLSGVKTTAEARAEVAKQLKIMRGYNAYRTDGYTINNFKLKIET